MPAPRVPYRGGSVRALPDKHCLVCSIAFRPKTSKQIICSFQCARVHTGRCNIGKFVLPKKLCAYCGVPVKRNSKKFCSHTCYARSRVGSIRPAHAVAKTRTANIAIWDGRRNESLRAWRKRVRMSSEWSEWRHAVFERDNYTCQKCGIRGGKLHPHHIRSFVEYPELAFDVSNGLTLCEPCHKQTDNYSNKRKGRRRKAQMFLSFAVPPRRPPKHRGKK